jgi:hypothetical protein
MKISSRLSAMFSIVMVVAGCKGDDATLDECKDVDFLFDSEACLEALATRCRTYATQADCWAAEPVKVAVMGDYAYCAWTNVATVSDGQTCEIADTFGRCEAALPAPLDGAGSVDACAEGEFSIEGDYTAFPDDLELVDSSVAAPDGTLYNALLYWTGSSVTPCADNVIAPVEVPPAPEWCSCAAAACLVTGD